MRLCLVRVLCKSIRASVRASASARARVYTGVCACVCACVRRYLLLRRHLEPALLRRDGRDRAVRRRWLRRVRPTLIRTGGALHSHANAERACGCLSVSGYVGVDLLVPGCWCLCICAHVCVCVCARV